MIKEQKVARKGAFHNTDVVKEEKYTKKMEHNLNTKERARRYIEGDF